MTPPLSPSVHELLRPVTGAEVVALPEVLRLFDALPAVDPEAMIGDWSGELIPTGHPGEDRLQALGWVGKSFRAADDVDPIVSVGEDGARVANPVLGSASLRRVEYRGVSTATMVYDSHPVLDHFRGIDADTVVGLMDAKGDPAPMAFLLRRL
jgi:hypothetical protein